jgi:hypothetical protein
MGLLRVSPSVLLVDGPCGVVDFFDGVDAEKIAVEEIEKQIKVPL